MSEEHPISPGQTATVPSGPVIVKVETSPARSGRSTAVLFLLGLLAASAMMNLVLLASAALSVPTPGQAFQTHRDGDMLADDKLAVIQFSGTIMPPYTDRWLNQIKDAVEDDSVKGVLLEIDSPGGLVADSHQLYHELQKLRDVKPVFVAMKRMAASGGYYIAMGAGPEGRIFAEPTTWTGSIGVIMPRYNAAELAGKIGIKAEPLVTGPLKGSLNPFRDLRDDERVVWDAIIDDSFQRFLQVISDNRSDLDNDAVRTLATGQVYTASQAVDNGLVDQIGFVEDAIDALATSLNLEDYQVVNYESPVSFMDVLLNGTARPPSALDQLLEAGVPKAFYYCSWNPLVPQQP